MSDFNRLHGYYTNNENVLGGYHRNYQGRIPVDNMEIDEDSEMILYQKRTNVDSDVTVGEYVGKVVGFVSLVTENLLSHPFIVLRRQCQVHNNSRRYHIIPFTLVPVIVSIHKHQGLTTLWKGLGSSLIVRGISPGVEDLISKITPWPKEIDRHSSLKLFFQHILLKSVSLAIVTPFYSASLVETVQSVVASEKPGFLDVFKEGLVRLLNWNGGAKGRMLPIWTLVLPTVALGLARYFFSLMIESTAYKLLHVRYKRKREMSGALPKHFEKIGLGEDIKLNASLIAIIATDITFYPFETILHRLHLQGTRTIIDNLDTGRSVLPILTNYQGPVDCYEGCVGTEGNFGLYKGFGALILQYAAHIALIHITRFILNKISYLLRNSDSPMINPTDSSGVPSAPMPLEQETYLLP